MSADFLNVIDWERPWLRELKSAARPILESADWRRALNDAASLRVLRNYRGLSVHFVSQEALPKGIPYETFIARTGAVPTRDNLHDFFNAMVWLTFPHIKAALNALQANAIERAASEGRQPGVRGQTRDAATLFDESAALVLTCEPSVEAELREHRWSEALWKRRDRFENETCQVFLFGHALMEKLVTPYKAITAHAWIVHADATDSLSSIDASVAQGIFGGLTAAAFTPLPVLGVPGWWPGQDEVFYLDTSVFRPKRGEA